jgi:hypothetical protein
MTFLLRFFKLKLKIIEKKKSYIWQYGFSELESSSDDGKMRVQFIFRNDAIAQAIGVRQLDVKVKFNIFKYKNNNIFIKKDIECDEPLALVYTLHALYVAKVINFYLKYFFLKLF